MNVIFFSAVEGGQGLTDDVLKDRGGEVNVDRTLVDGDDTGTLLDDYAGNGG